MNGIIGILLENRFSLPELTDGNGQSNKYCCNASLTSVALINEAIYDFLKAHKIIK